VKAISEIIAFLVLLGALTVAFTATLIIIPKYFSTYNSIALQAGYSQDLQGYQTSGSLTRTRLPYGYVLTVIIYNNAEREIKVNYIIVCRDKTIGGEKNILIPPRSIYRKVFPYYSSGETEESDICYLVVEEPGLLVYKVLES